MLEPHDRAELLQLARESIAGGLEHRRPRPPPERTRSAALLEPRATFTTLKLGGELRGCCGALEPVRALFADVWHTAWTSAFADPRFRPLEDSELEALEITISVLSPLEPIASGSEEELLAALRPREDGLLIAWGARRATFLPAVWDMLPEPRVFLAELQRKAGLSGIRISPALQAWRYRVESFDSKPQPARPDSPAY